MARTALCAHAIPHPWLFLGNGARSGHVGAEQGHEHAAEFFGGQGTGRAGSGAADGLGDLVDGHALFLRAVFGVSSSSQLAGRCGDPDLEIGCWRQAECVTVDFRALWSGCRARRGVLDQCEPVRGWLW
jgi:hypothetical protein